MSDKTWNLLIGLLTVGIIAMMGLRTVILLFNNSYKVLEITLFLTYKLLKKDCK